MVNGELVNIAEFKRRDADPKRVAAVGEAYEITDKTYFSGKYEDFWQLTLVATDYNWKEKARRLH
jgi:hypothetical protein